MGVGILTITHNEIGLEVLAAAELIVGRTPLECRSLSVHADDDPEQLLQSTQQLLNELDDGSGIIILTDIFGSTPCNIAKKLDQRHQLKVIGGLNLAMMVRIFNYAELPLEELADKAIEGAHNGIMQC